MTYLDEAADQLRLARIDNEIIAEGASASRGVTPVEDLLRRVNDRRMEIADGFTRLAAIERGLPPALGVPEEKGPMPEPRPKLRESE